MMMKLKKLIILNPYSTIQMITAINFTVRKNEKIRYQILVDFTKGL